MLIAYIIGFVTGMALASWISIKLMDAYLDYRIEKIFPKHTIVVVPDKKNNDEVPLLLEAIEKITTPEQLN